MGDKKLMLIDGNSLLHRAFYALPQLSTKEGVFTNGVYGFLTMFYRINDEYKPDYIGVVFDRKSPTFRHKEYVDYKAGRKKTPSELGMQFPILKDVLEKLNINTMELDGFEADDLAGTLAKFGEENDLKVILVTGDKDYLQLATDKTEVLITRKGISEIDCYDRNAMLEKYGITPLQFIDLKGLMGDKSDNIPGVPGVGEKTALKLLLEYGSIENIYENIDELKKGKLKENLIENRQLAFMSKRLATIVTNVPLNINLDDFKVEEPNNTELYEIYSKLEFKSLLSRLSLNNTIDEKDFSNEYLIIKDTDKINEIINDIKKDKTFAFKFVVNGENSLLHDVIGKVLKINENKTYYIDFLELDINEIMSKFKSVFEDENIKKIGHNLKEDFLILLRYDIGLNGIKFDSFIGQYLIDATKSSYSLKEIAREYLRVEIKDEEDLLGKGKSKKNILDISLEERSKFFVDNINVLYNSKELILNKIKEYDMEYLFNEVEMKLIEVLASMEFYGFKVDVEKLKSLGQEFEVIIDKLTKEIYLLSEEEFNINSPKQLGNILFEKLGLKSIKKTKTGHSTSAEVLEKLKNEHEIIEKILEYRHITKLKSTYVDGLTVLIDKKTNRVHSKFNQAITTTGRISSTEPNLQNIPIKTEEGRQIRKVFVPENEDYKLVDADYSQIELRVMAHLSDDEKLKEAFFTGEDIHTKTASEVFGVNKEEVTSLMRGRAKAVNFGIIYGISDFGLSRDLNITKKEAKQYIDNYLNHYEKVKKYMDDSIERGKEDGFITTILNRRRFLPELNSSNFNIRSFGERLAMNTPIQGSAADIIKVAMINVYNELKRKSMKSRLILQVHDELIIEAHKEELESVKEILKTLMENAVELSVPLKADMDVGDSWYDTK